MKLASILWLLLDLRLTTFHHLFSWTSLPPIKLSVRKAIWKSEEFPEYHMYSIRSLSQKFFLKGINFEVRHCKKFHYPLCKFTLHSLTASWSEINSLSPTAQLDFSWTFEMSDQKDNRFAKPSDNLWSSQSIMCTS